MDIAISSDKLGEFFFLDGDGEEANYGVRSNYERAAELTKALIKGRKSNQPGVKFK